VRNRGIWIGVERFHHDTHAPGRDARGNDRLGVVEREQAGFDANTSTRE
jgi:hypothetical protein